jgi:hypothetical protein
MPIPTGQKEEKYWYNTNYKSEITNAKLTCDLGCAKNSRSILTNMTMTINTTGEEDSYLQLDRQEDSYQQLQSYDIHPLRKSTRRKMAVGISRRKFPIWQNNFDDKSQLIKDDQYLSVDDEGSSRGKYIFVAKRQIVWLYQLHNYTTHSIDIAPSAVF